MNYLIYSQYLNKKLKNPHSIDIDFSMSILNFGYPSTRRESNSSKCVGPTQTHISRWAKLRDLPLVWIVAVCETKQKNFSPMGLGAAMVIDCQAQSDLLHSKHAAEQNNKKRYLAL